MSVEGIDRSLRDLVESAVNGEASAELLAQLEQRLLVSEVARDFYLEYVNLHSALRRRFLAAADGALGSPAELADFRFAVAGESFPVRRRRWLHWVSLALTAAVVLVAALVWRQQVSANMSREIATIQAVEGEATLLVAEVSRVVKVGDALRGGGTLRVGDEAARVTMEYPDGTQVRLHSGAVVQSPVDRGDVRLRLLAGSMEVDAAEQSPDRPLVFATEHSRYVVLGTRFRLYHEQEASRLELNEGKVRMERPLRGETVDVEAGSVAIAAEQTPVEIQPLSTGVAELQHSLRRAGQSVAFSSDEELLFTGAFDRGLKSWRVADAQLQSEHAFDAGESEGLASRSDGSTLVQVNRKGYVLVWRPCEDHVLKLPFQGTHVRHRALSPDGLMAAQSSDEGTCVYEIDLPNAQFKERLRVPRFGKAWCLALSQQGDRLAAGLWDGTLWVRDVATGEIAFQYRLQHTPTQVDLTADGKKLVVFTQKDGLVLIDLASGVQQSLWPPGSAIVRCLKFSPDGRRVMAGLNDRTARLWDVANGRQVLVVDAGHSPQGIAWSEKRQLLATADGTVNLWRCVFNVK
jgi:ferric-dicitrate binding protein FerR (iron transport regulator)